MDSPSSPNSLSPASLAQILDSMWDRFLPEILDRVSTLETVSQALSSGSLTGEQSVAAESAAHKLAGTLGTFNLQRGTDLARDLEQRFAHGSMPAPSTAGHIAASIAELRVLIETRPASYSAQGTPDL